jgi:transposase InsO family protein
VRYTFIEAEEAKYPVRVLCRCLEVSAAGYYGWLAAGPSRREQEDERLGVEVAAIFQENRRRYGSPRVHGELRDRGRCVSRKRVARLLSERGLRARSGRRKTPRTTDSRHGLPVAENRLARNFRTPAPNLAWVGDVTYLPTGEGWLYLAVLLDLFSRRVVGYALSERNDQALAIEALRRALVLRQPSGGLLQHTDRGSPYASDAYQALLAEHGIVPSMSRRGDCYDNAVAESFFSTLEHELGGEAKWATREEAMRAVSEYIDGFYNPTRRHSTIGGLSPIEFERRFRAQPENPGSRGSAPAPPRSSEKDRNQESPEISA